MKKIILITGGQRSGKSTKAEELALSLSDNPVCALPGDVCALPHHLVEAARLYRRLLRSRLPAG